MRKKSSEKAALPVFDHKSTTPRDRLFGMYTISVNYYLSKEHVVLGTAAMLKPVLYLFLSLHLPIHQKPAPTPIALLQHIKRNSLSLVCPSEFAGHSPSSSPPTPSKTTPTGHGAPPPTRHRV